MSPCDPDIAALAAKAADAARLLKVLSSEPRLLILCHLISHGELTVGALVAQVGLSQSALSQHLAKLRAEGIVSFRRDAQTLFYRVSDDRAGQILQVLRDIFCPELDKSVAPRRAARGRRRT